jgi:hypothetical protein
LVKVAPVWVARAVLMGVAAGAGVRGLEGRCAGGGAAQPINVISKAQHLMDEFKMCFCISVEIKRHS